jgi:hypothetical protein
MYNYYSHLFTHLAFLDIGYSSPGHNLTEQNVRFVNSMVKQTKGYEVFGYFLFFQEEDAVALMDANVCVCHLSLFPLHIPLDCPNPLTLSVERSSQNKAIGGI